jgi:hypothetical protein
MISDRQECLGTTGLVLDDDLASGLSEWQVGPITLDCGVLTVAGSDLRLVVYTAEPGPDADRLRLIQVIGLQKISGPDLSS